MMSEATDKSNEVLKEIIDNSWSGIGIIDATSKFFYLNEAFKPILGYTKEELLQLDFMGLMLPKYHDEFKELIKKNFKSEYTNNILVGCRRKDNQLVYLDISIKLMSNKKLIVINVNDVTQNIADHETFDKYVIQLHISKHGVIYEVSEAFCRLSLYKEEELLGQSYDKLVFPEINSVNLFNEAIEEFYERGKFTGVVASRNKLGDIFWVDMIIKPIKNKYGDTTGYSAVMFDITNEVKLEEDTHILQEEITDNQEKLEIMAQTMRTVAHEWRQPLNSISLDAQNLLISYELMDELVSKEEAVPVLKTMQGNIENLSGVISKFQYVTEFKSDIQSVNIDSVIEDAIQLSYVDKSVIEYKKIDKQIETYFSPLVKIIGSILDNAWDALSKAVHNLELKPFIKIETYEKDGMIVIDILNNGGNIPKDILDDIFNPYFSTKEEKNGVGLSLYVAKMIIEFHMKGKLKAINKDNNIVKFSITLPNGSEEE